MTVSVIVPAAGRGRRFGEQGNKIFERLGGRPVFIRTLERFVNREDVCQVILVVSEEDRPIMAEKYAGNLGIMNVRLVTGGPERCDSVRNALGQVDEEADLVAVHDAVRPCVSPLWIDAVFAAAASSGAAILACPVHGTLKLTATLGQQPQAHPAEVLLGEPVAAARRKAAVRRIVQETVPRSGLWEAQTPQVFRRELLLEAYAAAEGSAATDDAQLVEALGHEVTVVAGDPRNVKITTPGDLAVAAAVIESLPKPKPSSAGGPFDEAQW